MLLLMMRLLLLLQLMLLLLLQVGMVLLVALHIHVFRPPDAVAALGRRS